MGKPKSALPDTSYTPSTLPPAHIVVQLGPPQGSGNFTCTDADGVERLVEIGGKVKRSKVLVTRGNYAFVQLFPPAPPSESSKEYRLVGEIVAMISGKEVKAWRKSGEWPKGFDAATPVSPPQTDQQDGDEDVIDDDDGSDLGGEEDQQAEEEEDSIIN